MKGIGVKYTNFVKIIIAKYTNLLDKISEKLHVLQLSSFALDILHTHFTGIVA